LTESVSRTRIRFIMENKGESEGELIRYLAPRTVEALLRSMPIHGITAITKGMVYFQTHVKVGSEKPRIQLEAGTLAYWPVSSAVCICLDNLQPYSALNMIGKITGNLALLEQVGSGKRVRMEKI
jgi:hypothetical protein